MDAIVLVGGLGTRLRPLSVTRHKSLLPICNRPAIEYLFDWLRRSGIRRAILAIGQHNEDLAGAYPPGRYDGLEIVLVVEHERLESGGAIRNAVRAAGVRDRFVVLNGDVFVDFDFGAALHAHEAADAELTLALYPVSNPAQFGVAAVDEQSMVIGFVEKPPPGSEPGNLVNAGVWIFERALVDAIPPGAVRVEETLFPSLVARGRPVLGFRFEGLWADIGTSGRYLAINQALLARGHDGIAPGVVVHPEANVYLTCAGRGTSVGARAFVAGSVLWEDVRIAPGAIVEESVLADGVVVGAGAELRGVVAGRGAHIGPGAIVPHGASIQPGARYDAQDDR